MQYAQNNGLNDMKKKTLFPSHRHGEHEQTTFLI